MCERIRLPRKHHMCFQVRLVDLILQAEQFKISKGRKKHRLKDAV